MYNKVMVVDDNEIDLMVARRVMVKYQFAKEVITMDSATDALDYLHAHALDSEALPELIFLDINMPEMNGFQFLDSYTSLPEKVKKNCIIMMLTTSVHPEDRDKADTNPYVRNFLNKPLDEEKLKKIISFSKQL